MDNNASTGRSVDIELGGQEVITIDLENLDPNPEDVLDLLKDGQCNVWVWTKLAGEYWRRGYLDAAERIALSAVECQYHPNHLKQSHRVLAFQANGTTSSLPPIYSLLANIQIAHAQKAPKLKLPSARRSLSKL
jgi:RNA polymerase-associated protein CTR9